jgi:predicted GNAT superfamily acetyltransferase
MDPSMYKDNTIEIRSAVLDDIPQIFELAESLALQGLSSEERSKKGFLVSSFTIEDYLRLLGYVDHFYVAVQNSKLVAFMLAYSSIHIQDDEWLNLRIRDKYRSPFILIKQVVVAKEFMGKGIATSLYEYLMQCNSNMSYFVAVVLDPPNFRSIALHERLGFKQVCTATPPDHIPRGVWMI